MKVRIRREGRQGVILFEERIPKSVVERDRESGELNCTASGYE